MCVMAPKILWKASIFFIVWSWILVQLEKLRLQLELQSANMMSLLNVEILYAHETILIQLLF